MEKSEKNNTKAKELPVPWQFRRGNVFSDKCPSRDVLNHVTSRWGVLVFVALKDGRVCRFSELRRMIRGVSEKMLAQTLKTLEKDGLIRRVSYPVVPPHVEYSLTELGVGIAVHVVALADHVEENIAQIEAHKKSFEGS